MLLYKVIKSAWKTKDRVVEVFCLRDDAEKFADWENMAHDYSSFRVESFFAESVVGKTCVIDGETFMIRGVGL